VTLASAAFGATYGLRAFPHVVTMSLGTSTIMVLVATGVTGLVASVPAAAPVLSALAGLYILYLAYRIATAPPVDELEQRAVLPPLLGVYGMAVANPKAWGAMGALFSGFPLLGDPVTEAILKVGLLTALALVINTAWMLGGRTLARAMQTTHTSRALNLFFALLLVVAVVVMLFL
jgi:threonine/homoserine/homoserine lactone efflux protein